MIKNHAPTRWFCETPEIRAARTTALTLTKAVQAVALAFLLPLASLARPAPPAQPFQRLDGCVLAPDEWTDGDSFRVRLPDGRLATFRLYFVDTTESRSRGKRSDEQAAYFSLTRTQAVELGKVAKAFTAAALQKPFTIQTRWRPVFGPTRYYAFVFTADGSDLIELLVKNGLARIYGTRTPLPDGRDSRSYLAHLGELAAQAKAARRGGWGIASRELIRSAPFGALYADSGHTRD